MRFLKLFKLWRTNRKLKTYGMQWERFFTFPKEKENAIFFIKELERRLQGVFTCDQEKALAEHIVGMLKWGIKAVYEDRAITDEYEISVNLNDLQASSRFGAALGFSTFKKVCSTVEGKSILIMALMKIPA